MNNKTKNLILVIIFILLLLVGIYIWRSSGNKETLTNVVSTTMVPNTKEEKTIKEEGVDFVAILSRLKNLSLDMSFFNNQEFKNLSDFSVSLPILEPGRNNPFAPLGTEGSSSNSSL